MTSLPVFQSIEAEKSIAGVVGADAFAGDFPASLREMQSQKRIRSQLLSSAEPLKSQTRTNFPVSGR